MNLRFYQEDHQQTDEPNKSNTISVLFQLSFRFMYTIFRGGFEIRYWKFSDLIYVVMHLLSISTL